jgi:integrase
VPYKHPKTNQWYSDFMATDPETGRRRRFRRPLGDDIRTKREADEAERAMRVNIEGASKPTSASNQSAGAASEPLPAAAFSGFWRYWIALKSAERKPSVIRGYRSICNAQLEPFFGDREIATITRLDIEELRAKAVAGGAKQKTVNNIMMCLSSMLNAAVEWGYLRTNPCKGMRLFKTVDPTLEFYTAAETKAWLDACRWREPKFYALFFCGFRTGLRVGELLALEWGDVDFHNGVIHVRRSVAHATDVATLPKSGKTRTVPMSPALMDVLRAHKHLRSDLVFCRPDGKRIKQGNLRRPWARITRASGLKAIRLHDMRHSFASQLVMAGVPMKAVQDMLGHGDMKMTARYSHLSPGLVSQYVGLLDGHNSSHTSATPASGSSGTTHPEQPAKPAFEVLEGGASSGLWTRSDD